VCVGTGVEIHTFFTLALAGAEWSISHSSHFTLRPRMPITNWTGGWMYHKASLDAVAGKKSNLCQK